MTCKKTQGFLAKAGVTPTTVVNAKQTPLDLKEVKGRLLQGVDEIVSMKRGRVESLRLKDKPDDRQLERALIGPTGRLRGPTARVGRRLLVGFDEATYREALG